MIKKTAQTLIQWLIPGAPLKITNKQINQIDREALNILERLKRAGFESYLVGGCVRDLLLGKKPKDFDIATRATPQQVKSLVHRSFIIGRRFRIVVAKRRPDPISEDMKNHPFLAHAPLAKEKEFQITTFRRAPVVHDGIVNENVFGDPQDDAQRRDFTINGLFLDAQNLRVVDFVGGLKDLKTKTLRMIGNPEARFKEDPIRILRALRFLHRAHLKWDNETFHALKKTLPSLGESKKERVREELIKMLREGSASTVFLDLDHLNAWHHISPEYAKFHKRTEFRKFHEELIVALERFPWPDDMDTVPLFFVLLLPALLYNNDSFLSRIPDTLDPLFNELKVSKKEKEGLERILQNLQKIRRDVNCQNPERILIRNPKIFEHLNRCFFILKLFSNSTHTSLKNIFPSWEKAWKHYSNQMRHVSGQHRNRARQHRGRPHAHQQQRNPKTGPQNN